MATERERAAFGSHSKAWYFRACSGVGVVEEKAAWQGAGVHSHRRSVAQCSEGGGLGLGGNEAWQPLPPPTRNGDDLALSNHPQRQTP